MNSLPPFFARLSPRSRWAYVLTMPWFAVIFSFLLVGPGYLARWETFVGATLLNAVILTGTFLTQNTVSEWITRRYQRFDQTVARVGVSLLAHAVISGVFLLVVAGLYVRFRLFGSTMAWETLLTIYLVNLLAIFLVTAIYETFHAINQWKQRQLDKERLKKETLQGQLQGLKSQVSPHFLFNSLNSLSSLIADEPARAEQFVDQMARVYRYLLQANNQSGTPTDGDSELTTLERELVFIESYYHLLKTRHGEGLHLRVGVEDRLRGYRLPPLTLQLLVENAVKHNVVSPQRPLYIDIATTPGPQLQIRNNLQKKAATAASRLESTRIGLANIRAKYQLLGQDEPQINPGPDAFTVTLPLIGPLGT
jgi:two-component system LytT family sensor kinase